MTSSKLFTAAVLLTAATTTSGEAVSLTMKNYEAEMSGRNAFIKFQAPWWGHCKSMKPAWDKLGDEYAGSSSVLIADVDCTAEGKDFCDKNGVQGFPTIKYYMDGDTEEGTSWEGGRDFDSLKTHVDDNLEVKCLIADPSNGGCDEKQQDYINKMKMKSEEERTKQLERLDGMKGETMAPSNKKWVMQRLGVLRQFKASTDSEL